MCFQNTNFMTLTHTEVSFLSCEQVVLLDEPSAGLDPENRRLMWDLLLKVRRTTTIFMSTHDMEEADILADRIIILSHGHMLCYSSPAYLKKWFGKGHCCRSLQFERRVIEALLVKFENGLLQHG